MRNWLISKLLDKNSVLVSVDEKTKAFTVLGNPKTVCDSILRAIEICTASKRDITNIQNDIDNIKNALNEVKKDIADINKDSASKFPPFSFEQLIPITSQAAQRSSLKHSGETYGRPANH
jgi:hypothetical protein